MKWLPRGKRKRRVQKGSGWEAKVQKWKRLVTNGTPKGELYETGANEETFLPSYV